MGMFALPAATGHAQEPSPQQRIAAFKAALAKNQAELRQYTWLETTQIALNGEVKQTRMSDCRYAGGSKPQCTQVGPAPEEPKVRGPLRKRMVEKKVEELKDYMDSVKTLITQYVPPEGERIQKAFQGGNVSISPNPAAGTTRITVNNYAKQGDAVTFTIHPTTNQVKNVSINTWLNDPKAKVTLAVQFSTLPNGVSYAYQKVVNATAKGVTVTVTSSDFAEPLQP